MLRSTAEAVADVLRGSEGATTYSPVAALTATRTLSLVVEDTMRALASHARASGATWQEIGTALGTTRQAAFARFGPHLEKENLTMEAAIPDADVRAVATFEKYAKQDWSLRDDFDETMDDRLSPEMLDAAWQQVVSQVGVFEGVGEPSVSLMQEHTIVDVPMRFEHAEMKGRIAYDSNGKVAGLFVLNPDVP